jgi:hypothetical protein
MHCNKSANRKTASQRSLQKGQFLQIRHDPLEMPNRFLKNQKTVHCERRVESALRRDNLAAGFINRG